MTQTGLMQPTMADLMKKVTDVPTLVVGEKVAGTIIHISKGEVIMDIDNVGLGLIRGRELYNDNFVSGLKLGESVEAVVKSLENERNMTELSFRAVGRDKIWGEIVAAYENRTTVEVKIRDTNRGGFLIQAMGVYGFLPASLLAPAHAIKPTGDASSLSNQMKKYIGQVFKAKIVSIDAENDTVIVSEKAIADEVASAKLKNYTIGQVVDAEVTGVVDFGAFVRFDEDLEGLVHVSELSWKKIDKAEDVVKVGQHVQAKITEIDEDNRISLSIKQTQENPWTLFSQSVEVGDKFVGLISKITTFGIVAVNDQDIAGICHISQLLEDGDVTPATIHEHFKVGDKKEFSVLAVEKDKLYLTLLSDQSEAQSRLKAQKQKDKEAKKEAEIAKIAQELKSAKDTNE
jgi:small subunit ribosomal protein S1